MKKIRRLEVAIVRGSVTVRVIAPAARGALYTAHSVTGEPGQRAGDVARQVLDEALTAGRGVPPRS